MFWTTAFVRKSTIFLPFTGREETTGEILKSIMAIFIFRKKTDDLRNHPKDPADFIIISVDGRGLSEEQRSLFCHEIKEWILADWMPWYTYMLDYRTIDVNRYVKHSYFDLFDQY